MIGTIKKIVPIIVKYI